MKVLVVVPTFNAGDNWGKWIEGVNGQKNVEYAVLVIDSSSTDDTAAMAESAGFRTIIIKKHEFNHGATRQMALEINEDADIYLYMTQDALPANENAFSELLAVFFNEKIGAAYGCQLSRKEADFFEAFARRYNYPNESVIKGKRNAGTYGIKTVFMSNSFAAYRRKALSDVGGFPGHLIMAEDMYAAAKMVLAGWNIAYCSSAKVYHSHAYSITEEFRRYFDTGVFHALEPWIKQNFGGESGEGTKFAISEIKELMKESPAKIPLSIARNLAKWVGFKLGENERFVPLSVKRRIGMLRGFWYQFR